MYKQNKDNNFNELLKGSSISLFLKVLGMFLGYLAMLFVTNNYGAKEWGIYSLCFAILSICSLLPKFGFDNSLVRIISELNAFKNTNEIKKVITKSIVIATVLSLAVIVLINSFAEYISSVLLKNQEIRDYIKIISFTIAPVVCIAIVSAFFQALKKMAPHILFQTTLINFFFLIFLVLSYWQKLEVRVFDLYFLSTSLSLITAVLFLIYSIKKTKSQTLPVKTINYGYAKIVGTSFPMLMSNSIALLMGWSDIIVLSYYKSASDIGIYDATLRLATISTISLIAINAIATPKFVEFYSKNDLIGLKDTVQKSTKLIFFTSTPLLFIIILFSKKILGFFGDEFVVGYLALTYLCVSRFVNAISGSVGYIMQMTDRQKTFQNVLIIALIINLLLNLILIPKYSYEGAAIASAIAMVFWNLTLVAIIKKRFGFWTFMSFNIRK